MPLFGSDRCGTLRYGQSYLGVHKRLGAAFKNVQQGGHRTLHLGKHYTEGAFADTVVAAAPKPCTMALGRKPIRTFCAFFPVLPDSQIADFSVLLRRMPTKCKSHHPHQFSQGRNFHRHPSCSPRCALIFRPSDGSANVFVVGHRMTSQGHRSAAIEKDGRWLSIYASMDPMG